MKQYDVVIIGGGITGLVAAYKLSKSGKKVLVIEKQKQLGGMLRSVKREKYSIEEFYHHIFQNNAEIINLIKEIGLIKKLTWKEASTSFYYKNNFYRMTIPTDLLKFKPLSFSEKMKLSIFLLRIRLINPEKLDHISAKDFIIRRAGNSVYEKFFKPLLSAKYGKNLHKISAAWFVERINTRNKRGYKGEILGYMKGGFEIIIKKLEEEIKRFGGEILTGKEVKKLSIKNNKISYLVLDNKKIYADYLISTISSLALLKICEFPENYKEKIQSLGNQGTICVLLGLKKKITDFYWTNLIKDTVFRVIVEHTNFQPFENYKEHIIYLASYPDEDSYLWNLNNKQLFSVYFRDLQKVVKIKIEDVNWFEVIKEKEAGLIYNKGILSKVLSVKTPLQNLYIAGMLNSYPDRNLEQSVKLADKVVSLINNK